MSHIELGPFTLHGVIGRGGMGEVWRGVHREQQVPVAIKVITSAHALDRRFIDGFEREVQATAGLDHPGICRVFDHGTIPARVSAPSLQTGSPWLAMELATGGSLEEAPRFGAWEELRAFLLSLLDALAHAHARGIVHRDLKPANVLLKEVHHHATRYLLSDFGLAHAIDPSVARSEHDIKTATAGTPYYMAPEQLLGQWRDYGSWTDLYALGCMTYELCSGRPPFIGKSNFQIASRHLEAEMPKLAPRFSIPRDLEGWILGLLCKEWRARYRTAAEAAWALRNMSDEMHFIERIDEGGVLGHMLSSTSLSAPTIDEVDFELEASSVSAMTIPSDTELLNELTKEDLARELREGRAPFAIERSHRHHLPMAPSWRGSEPHTDSMQLIGAGLGLFGLREVPFVGRAKERDTIWNALRLARSLNHPRVVLVRGGAGTGKSRLATWIARRANEIGAAQLVKATHSAHSGAMDGIETAISRNMRCFGLEGTELFDRLLDVLAYILEVFEDPEYIASALTELLAPGSLDHADMEGASVVRFSSPTERLMILSRWFETASDQQPVIFWIEDAQWADDALSLVEMLLDRAAKSDRPGRICVIITAREDLLAHHPTERQRLLDLEQRPETDTISLAPLAADEHRQFVRELLGVHPDLEQEIVERTEGNPMFAVQIVRDWVERDLFEVGDRGFQLKPGSETPPPASVMELWIERLDQITRAGLGDWRLPLEIAAALGHNFPMSEWHAACQTLGADTSRGIARELFARGFFTRSDASVTWAHTLLRESIRQQSQDAGRWRDINLALAILLEEDPIPTPKKTERRAFHLIEAQELERSLGVLEVASGMNVERSRYKVALELQELHGEVCDVLGLGADDIRRIAILPEYANTLRFTGDMARSKRVVEDLLALTAGATEHALKNLHADACRILGAISWLDGDLREADRLTQVAIELYTELGDDLGRLRTYHSRGWLFMRASRHQEALDVFDAGSTLGMEIEDLSDRAWCEHGLSSVLLRMGDAPRALEHAQIAHDLFSSAGRMSGVGFSMTCIADAKRWLGAYEEADAIYARSCELLESLGSTLLLVALFRRCINDLMRDDWGALRAQVEKLPSLERVVARARADASILRGCLAAHDNDPDAFEHALHIATGAVGVITDAHPDQVVVLQKAAAQWRRHGREPLARRCEAQIALIAKHLKRPDLLDMLSTT